MSEIALQVEGLTKSYGELVAVDNLSLEVREGEVLGLLGPNGAGKTTSINMMCGLLKPDAGRVLVHNQPIVGGDRDTRSRVGVCPQEVVLWGRLTCLEQLQFIGQLYGLRGRDARQHGEQLLEGLGLKERRNKQARTLSGGLQRRMNLAMALVHDPDIVVLDEPEVGLDPQSRVAVRNYIKRLAQRKTVILTTHNMDEADRLADRVAIVDHGRLLELDTPRALKNRVGKGDILQIGLKANGPYRQRAQSLLAQMDQGFLVSVVGDNLHVQTRDAVNLLPRIVEELKAAHLPVGEVRLRESTLEDAFIQLTGRRLRE